jgi:AcrR family transcriptional regulator
MVATPWGMSETLRERGVRPGPGNPPEETAQNQRERLFGAMVASVSERGYAATRVADLSKLSGVSSKSFYKLFDDKKDCFVATVAAMVEAGIAYAAMPGSDSGGTFKSWEGQIVGINMAFAQMVLAQPASARLLLLHAHEAGTEALETLGMAVAALESLAARRTAKNYPEYAGLPPEIITGMVVSVQEIARTRLRSGREEELPGLIPDFAKVIASWTPPPEPLRLATRPPAFAPETLDAHDRSERALRAFTAVVAERGYADTSINQVVKRASMSQTTFYAHFRNKEDALMAAIDSAGAQIVAAVLPASRRNLDWTHGVRAAFGALFNFLASRPSLARLMMVEVYAAGPEALRRRDEALRPLEKVLVAGWATSVETPRIATEVILGAVYGLAYKKIQSDGPESLPSLAAACTYMSLTPFIGAEAACEAANGGGLARGAVSPAGAEEQRGSMALEKRKVLTAISERTAGVEEVVKQTGVPVEEVKAHVAELAREGLIAVVEDGAEEEPRYRLGLGWIDEDLWLRMSWEERERISARIREVISTDIDRAVEARSFDRRLDRHLSRSLLTLDEEGWRRATELHDSTLAAMIEIEREAIERLARSEEMPINARSILTFFEMPPEDP